jgi:RHS repeat-associated protein
MAPRPFPAHVATSFGFAQDRLYNAAGFLTRAETHDGTAYQPQAEMQYNGLGERVSMTGWQGEISLTTSYVLDLTRRNGVLTAEVTLARSYTLWGEVRQQVGTGSFTWGYFGGLMDAATGLVYVGGGQYYDPATGRFLTSVNRDGTNRGAKCASRWARAVSPGATLAG